MADESNSNEDVEKPAKLAKLESDEVAVSSTNACPFESFDGFKFKRILKESPENRVVVVEGFFGEETVSNVECVSTSSSVVILEKTHFTESEVEGILTGDTALECLFNNDVYYNLLCQPLNQLNRVKATVIHPATAKHIEKYSTRQSFLIEETSLVYQSVTLPHIRESKFDLQVGQVLPFFQPFRPEFQQAFILLSVGLQHIGTQKGSRQDCV